MAEATTRCEKPWFHTQTRLPADERLTAEQWEIVRAREEKRLGFSGLPCIWSFHVNEATGERHMHAVWFRVDVEQERAVDPGLFKLRLKETCRVLEKEFGLRELNNHRQPHDVARAADRNEVEVNSEKATVENALQTYNDAVALAFDEVSQAVDDLNQVIAGAREIIDQMVSEWNSEFEDKSEAWQNGDRGEEARSLIDEWESFAEHLEEVSVDEPDELFLDLSDLDDVPSEARATA